MFVGLVEAGQDLGNGRIPQGPLRGRGTEIAALNWLCPPGRCTNIAQLGRTLWRRCVDILAFFDHHASNGPTEAINGRLEALRRNSLGFRNLTRYR